MPFEFETTEIDGVIIVKSKKYADNRGYFFETYEKTEFANGGIDTNFIQDNYSKSYGRVLRGLHFQKYPYEQSKLVRCVKGRILDVAVDIRPNSRTFKKYVKLELSEGNGYQLYIPKGFAHGFAVLSDEAEVNYKTDKEYCPKSESGIFWSDETLNIDWGIDFEPILSERDKNLPKFKDLNI